MTRQLRLGALSVLAAMLVLTAGQVNAQEQQLSELNRFLSSGQFDEGEAAFQKAVEEDADDGDALFSLAVVQMLGAIEQAGQSLYQHGLDVQVDPRWREASPFPVNDNPQAISYNDFRGIVTQLVEGLSEAQQSFAQIGDKPVSVTVRLSEISLDLTGDGEAETKLADLMKHDHQGDGNAGVVTELTAADAHLLHACNSLMLAQYAFYLAHDAKETFDRTAHAFFAKADTPYANLRIKDEAQQDDWKVYVAQGADVAAMVHLIQWEVTEPQRMRQSLEHLESAVQAGKHMLEALDAQEDPQAVAAIGRRGLIPRGELTDEKKQEMSAFLDEAEQVLGGEKLMRHWRFEDRGVNLRRVFTEPQRFDLVLWIQGSAAVPYLEEGSIADDPWQDEE